MSTSSGVKQLPSNGLELGVSSLWLHPPGVEHQKQSVYMWNWEGKNMTRVGHGSNARVSCYFN